MHLRVVAIGLTISFYVGGFLLSNKLSLKIAPSGFISVKLVLLSALCRFASKPLAGSYQPSPMPRGLATVKFLYPTTTTYTVSPVGAINTGSMVFGLKAPLQWTAVFNNIN